MKRLRDRRKRLLGAVLLFGVVNSLLVYSSMPGGNQPLKDLALTGWALFAIFACGMVPALIFYTLALIFNIVQVDKDSVVNLAYILMIYIMMTVIAFILSAAVGGGTAYVQPNTKRNVVNP